MSIVDLSKNVKKKESIKESIIKYLDQEIEEKYNPLSFYKKIIEKNQITNQINDLKTKLTEAVDRFNKDKKIKDYKKRIEDIEKEIKKEEDLFEAKCKEERWTEKKQEILAEINDLNNEIETKRTAINDLRIDIKFNKIQIYKCKIQDLTLTWGGGEDEEDKDIEAKYEKWNKMTQPILAEIENLNNKIKIKNDEFKSLDDKENIELDYFENNQFSLKCDIKKIDENINKRQISQTINQIKKEIEDKENAKEELIILCNKMKY